MDKKDTVFKNKGYCFVKDAISPELRDFVTQYALFDEMQSFDTNDNQVPNAHSKYGDPSMESMLLHLQPLIEKNTGLKLYPTYSYYRIYRNNDELVPHKDRPSCEISATMCFNFSYDTKDFNWPIFMDGQEIKLMPGDLVIYRGCDLLHWREKLTHDQEVWHVQGFFHYVDVNGPYPEYKFDKRSSIGECDRSKKHIGLPNKSYIIGTS